MKAICDKSEVKTDIIEKPSLSENRWDEMKIEAEISGKIQIRKVQTHLQSQQQPWLEKALQTWMLAFGTNIISEYKQ